jgi:hypothetical protein
MKLSGSMRKASPVSVWLADIAVILKQYDKCSSDTQFNLEVRGKGGDHERLAECLLPADCLA